MPLLISTTWLGVDRTDIRDALDGIRGLGVDGVELGSTHAWRDDFAAVVRDAGLGTVFVHNFFPPARDPLVVNLASPDAAIRSRSVDHATQCLRFAAEIGSTLYTVHPGFLNDPAGKQQDRVDSPTAFDFAFTQARTGIDLAFQLMVESLCTLCDEARRLGVGLAVETQGSLTAPGVSILETPENYDRFFAAVPAEISVNLNLAHTAIAGRAHGFSVDEFVARIRPRIAAVEVSHHDGERDLHAGLVEDSPALDWVRRLADLPLILELRDVDRATLEHSVRLARTTISAPANDHTGLPA